MAEKKAGDILLDTQLGEKKFDLPGQKPEADAVFLNIEGATPVMLLETMKRGGKLRKGRTKSFLAKMDETLKSMGQANPKDIATFFRLMAVMLNAGVPLVRSLDVIAEQTTNGKLKKTIFEIGRTIERGGNLSGGLASAPDIFSESQVGMVRSGEASGQLNHVLLDLASEVEKSTAIKKKIKGALMYPAFIMVVLALVIAAMLVLVVPKIAEIFSAAGQALPLITRIVIGASNFVQFHWMALVLGVLILVGGFPLGRRLPGFRHAMDELILYVPIIGQLVRKSLLARFARSLGNLIKSGVPIVEALKINAKGVGNEVYRERILLAAEDLTRGIPLAESLRDSPLFPSLLVQMIAVGEQTAQLETIAQKIADYYEEEVDIAVQSFTKLLEPLIIVMVGGSVGTIVAAIMLPIIQLTTVSQGL